MSNSFKHYSDHRPLAYRTPSPPRCAFEPISPTPNGNETAIDFYGDLIATDTRTMLCSQRVSLSEPSRSFSIDRRQDYLSNGSMDIFADIAIATKSTNISFQANTPPSKRKFNASHEAAQSTKRIRSEKASFPTMACRATTPGTRPATSCEQSLASRMMEAELLLNFSQGAKDAWPCPMREHTGIHQVRRASDTMLRLPSRVPAHDQQKCVVRNFAPRSPSGKQNIHSLRNDPSLTNQVDVRKNGASHRPPNYISPNESKGTQPFETAVTAHKLPEIVVGYAQDIHSETKYEEDSYGIGQEDLSEPSHRSRILDNTGIINDDFTKKHANTKFSDPEVERSVTFHDEIFRGHITDEIAASSVVSKDGELDLLAERVTPACGSSIQPVTRVREGSKAMSENREQIASNTNRRPTGGTIQLTHSPTSAAVCAVCKFAQNSLSIDSENNATSWINCDGCKSWFHFACAGFKNEREVRSVDKYRCKKCKPIHGTTTYVRKSSRAHSAIDYAGLHQGVIKTSDDRPEHHYIQPIKDGTITFLPENFARIRPELVTAEYFEKGIGMKEPVVIPAALNPQPHNHAPSEQLEGYEPKETLCSSTLEENINLEEWFSHDLESQRVPDEGQDGLDMVMPQGLSVRKVAELYGPEEKVEVIDVKSQNGENKKWNMRRWVDYYENQNHNKIVRNVISLEVSQSRLGRLIRRPRIVRDLDLQDSVWPEDLLAKGEFPRVQLYCLMSVADCFTDFHIDFGGSSVFYHVLKGKKTFFFIPPKEKYLKKYEDWCMSPAQNWTFLPDQTKECYRVDLSEGDTMLIPSGWIHAVWTPEDSLVIGGNFLTRMNYGMQLRIAQVEKITGVARKFRYPHFQKLHWYTALRYLEDDPLPDGVRDLLESGNTFSRETPSYCDFDDWGENSRSGPENYHARYYSQPELEGLPDLARYLLRTALIEIGSITDGISADTRNAVKRSIPRGHGEPLDIIKAFAIWCAWKRGNEPIPHWAYPDAMPEHVAPDKLSAAASKKLDQEAALEAPRRQSARTQSQRLIAKHTTIFSDSESGELPNAPTLIGLNQLSEELGSPSFIETASPQARKRSRIALGSGSGSHRKTACDSCRRRRRACKHKDQVDLSVSNASMLSTPIDDTASPSLPADTLLGDRALQEKLSLGGGPFQSPPAESKGLQVVIPSSGPNPPSKYDIPSQLSDSILPVSPRVGDPSSNEELHRGLGATTISGNVGSARPRTKACNECRKSKVCRLTATFRGYQMLTIILETLHTRCSRQ